MKNLFLISILTPFLIFSCTSSKKYLVNGNYDAAINKSVTKILKSKKNSEQILLIDNAYKIANEQDLRRAKFLEMENNPENWEEITRIYQKLIARQAKVRTITPFHYKGATYEYKYTDYDQALIEAKRKASNYLYLTGKKEIQAGTKEAVRNAWSNFMKTKELSGNLHDDIDELIVQCEELGTSNVLVRTINNTHLRLSPEFMDNILLFNTSKLNDSWVRYHTRHLDDNIEYDYFLNINLKSIFVSPNEEEDKDIFEERKVEDGWDYVLDNKGNVLKDSLGNDIKVKKYKTLKCSVTITNQFKSSTIKGTVEYLSLNPPTLIEEIPVSIKTDFEHQSARAIGDWDALCTKTKSMCQTQEIPFPTDEEMVYLGTERLKEEIKNVIYTHKQNIY